MKNQPFYDREKRQIPIDRIILPKWGDLRSWRDNAFASRLLSDLSKEGLYSLPIVRPCPDKYGLFECLDGWSRIEQLRVLGEKSVECLIMTLDDSDAIVLSLKMNLIRKSHDPIGIAKTFKLLHDAHNMKYAEIARRFGYSRSYAYKLVKLLELPKDIQKKVAQGDITIKDALDMVAGRYSPDVLTEDKAQVCDFCHGDYEAHLINRLLVCYRCQHELSRLIARRERQFEEELKERAKRAKEGQKTLISE